MALVTVAALGQGEVKAKPDTPKQAADKIISAGRAGDESALEELAGRDDPDPWLVADELCLRGAHDAAEAFARAAPRKDTEKLPAYVAAQRGGRTNAAARKALAVAHAAKDPNTALAALDASDGTGLVSVLVLAARGRALRSLQRLEESASAYLAAADAAERLGWLARAALSAHHGGVSAYSRSDWDGALAAWARRRALEESRGNRGGIAASWSNIGIIHEIHGDFATALDCYGKSLEITEALGDDARTAATLINMGIVHHRRGDHRQALDCHERGLRLAEAIGHRRWAANALVNLGNVHKSLRDYAKALEFYGRALKIQEELGDGAGIGSSLNNVGAVHELAGDYTKALDFYGRALRILEELGDRAGIAKALQNMGAVHWRRDDYTQASELCRRSLTISRELRDPAGIAASLIVLGKIHERLGDYTEALDLLRRALAIEEKLGVRAEVCVCLNNLGIVHEALGDYAEAMDSYGRALKINEEIGDPAGIGGSLSDLGAVHELRGDYTGALELYGRALRIEKELGDRNGIAVALNNIGNVYLRLGDYPGALDSYNRSLEIKEELGDRAGIAGTLNNIGSIHERLTDYPKALELRERSLKIAEDIGDRAAVAAALNNIGNVHQLLGDCPKALDIHTRALKIREEIADRAGIAGSLHGIGRTHERAGDYAKALDAFERSFDTSRDIGSTDGEASALWGMASAHWLSGEPGPAASTARRVVGLLGSLVGGVSEERGASAREEFAAIFDLGALASRALRDPAGVSFFLESGRAGALLESLKARERLQDAVLPKELLDAEQAARVAETVALRAHRRALGSGVRAEINKTSAALQAAREERAEVIARVQRTAKAAADVLYPKAAPLEQIQATLAPGDALILYALWLQEAVALVVRRDSAEVVSLGQTASLEEACAALIVDPRSDSSAAAETLRKRLVTPLGLDRTTTRWMISPQGVVSYVPFVLLAGEAEVVYVPSGTTYGVLREERAKRGQGVLALGDPVYGAALERTVLHRGSGLAPLPATREEARSVGDEVLLGHEATETSFAQGLTRRPRWRAVHLACHGLMCADQPQLSSLALTPDEDNDALLTVLEVFRMEIPADLVVLSACETAKGKIYRAEGVIGFTRAFMFAGAPRVIVSLWKVDDEATRALMVRFYELWNPKDGSKGLPTATALKKAMEFVRDHPDHPEWKDPKYWAAWQLWGLGD